MHINYEMRMICDLTKTAETMFIPYLVPGAPGTCEMRKKYLAPFKSAGNTLALMIDQDELSQDTFLSLSLTTQNPTGAP